MSQLEKIAYGITNQFNTKLRDSLKYVEAYLTYRINEKDNSIILAPDMHTYKYTGTTLYDMLKNNPKLLENIRINLRNGLKGTYQEIGDVELSLIKDKLILIRLIINPFILKGFPDIGIYVNIASNLTLRQLDDFCSTDKSFEQLCKSQELWSELFMNRYPGYPYERLRKILNKDQINFQRLYKGLLFYEEYIFGKEVSSHTGSPGSPRLPYLSAGRGIPADREAERNLYDDVMEMLTEASDSFTFLVKIGQIAEDFIALHLVTILYLSTINLLDVIYEVYPNLFTDERLQDLSDNIRELDNYMFPLEKYLWAEDKLGHEVTNIELVHILSSDNMTLAKEIIEYLPDDIDIELIIPEMKNQIINDSNRKIPELLYNKYGDKLNEKDVRMLLSLALK